jgi:hypothetical protein
MDLPVKIQNYTPEELGVMSVEDLEVASHRLDGVCGTIREIQVRIQDELGKRTTLDKFQQMFAALSDKEKAAASQVLAAQGAPSQESVSGTKVGK